LEERAGLLSGLEEARRRVSVHGTGKCGAPPGPLTASWST
jgi:hypothetical protein